MPSQQEVKWSQLKVGLIVLGSTILLCILLFLMTSSSGLRVFSKKIYADCYFADSSGLQKGAEVLLQGVTIGDVKEVAISNDPLRRVAPVHVTLKLDPRFAASLHKDSRASLTKVGLVGDTVVNINSQTAVGPPLRDGDTLPSMQATDMDAVMTQAKTTAESLDVTLAKLNVTLDSINHGEGSVGQLVKNRELYDNLNATTRELHNLVVSVNGGRGSVGKLLNDDKLYNRLNDMTTRLDDVATNLQQGKGSAGKLLNDETLYNNLNSSLVHLNSILADADAGKGGLGLLTKDPAFAQKLDNTVTNLNGMLADANAGKGTLGKFAKDDQAYNNLNTLLKSSNDLVTTIRSDPRKYLTIHLKIF